MQAICPKTDCSIRDECEWSKIHDRQDDNTHCCASENNDCPMCMILVHPDVYDLNV